MNVNQVARELLSTLSLPYGTVSILPWHEKGHVVLHVLVDRAYLRRAKFPANFQGYDVVVEERTPTFAN